MKKRTAFCAAVLALLLLLAGCAPKPLTYLTNLGYELEDVEYSRIVFRVYHPNAETHMWEQLAEFPCCPVDGHYADVRADGSQGHIEVILEDNRVEKAPERERYETDDAAAYGLDVAGFSGNIRSEKNFEVRDTVGEQCYRLYPISNENGTYFADPSLDKPYDPENVNLDDILITVTIEK